MRIIPKWRVWGNSLLAETFRMRIHWHRNHVLYRAIPTDWTPWSVMLAPEYFKYSKAIDLPDERRQPESAPWVFVDMEPDHDVAQAFLLLLKTKQPGSELEIYDWWLQVKP